MDNVLTYTLPLTTSTGKARVKRRKNNFGEPVAVTGDNKFQVEDYIEWQISYFMNLDSIWSSFRKSKNLNEKIKLFEESFSFFKPNELISELKSFAKTNQNIKKADFKRRIKEVFEKHGEIIITKPYKNNQEYVMYELSDLFRLALKNGIASKREIEDLLKFNEKEKVDIEAQTKVSRVSLNNEISDGFKSYEEKYPLFIKEINDKSFVEIQVKHKQKAVGFQSMIYFCVYLKHIKDSSGKSIIGRSADSKELVNIDITKDEIIAIAKSFIIASEDHSRDIKTILHNLS